MDLIKLIKHWIRLSLSIRPSLFGLLNKLLGFEKPYNKFIHVPRLAKEFAKLENVLFLS